MKLNSFYTNKTGTLAELIQFENVLNGQNNKENLLYKNALQKREDERIAKENKEKREKKMGAIAAASIFSVAIVFILVLVFHRNGTVPANTGGDSTISTAYSVYYVKTRHAYLLTSVTNGKVAYTVPKGTPLTVTSTGPRFYGVTYNGSTLYVLASRLSLTVPLQEPVNSPAMATVPAENNTAADETDQTGSTSVLDDKVYTVVFNDHFKNNTSGWPVQQNDQHRYYFSRHAYEMESFGTGISEPVVFTKLNTAPEHYIEATFIHVSGDADSGFGLAFSYEDGGNNYVFEISAAGNYRICHFQDNTYYTLLPWAPSNQILTGNGQPNTLKIWRRGVLCEFYINGSLVNTIDNMIPAGNYTGFVLENNQHIKAKAIIIGQAPEN